MIGKKGICCIKQKGIKLEFDCCFTTTCMLVVKLNESIKYMKNRDGLYVMDYSELKSN